MDNLTHTATGLFLSRAGLGRGAPHGVWILVLAANAPDADVISGLWGSLAYLKYHRHLTHALLGIPLMAVLPVLVVALVARRRLPWLRAYTVSLIGVASHPALDLTNVYGVRLLLPFSAEWYRLDSTYIVDLWIWAAFLLALSAPFLARLVGAEIGAQRGAAARNWALFALAFLALYNGARVVLHARAVATLEARLFAGHPPDRVGAFPGALNPLAWRGVAETAEFVSLHELNLLNAFDPDRGRLVYKPQPSPALQAARRTAEFQVFLEFSQLPLWRVEERQVQAVDLRFGFPWQPAFRATARLDERGRVERAWVEFRGGRGTSSGRE